MTTRVGNYGTNQYYISLLNSIQQRQVKEQSQVSTNLKSTIYSGISMDAFTALSLESQKTQSSNYIDTNDIATTRLDTTNTTLEAIKKSVSQFSASLDSFSSGNTTDPQRIQTLQTQAFNSMVDLANYLNTNVGGTYIFSGGRTSTPSVDLPATSLSQFQSMYDGTATTFPTTRASDLVDISISSAQSGALTVDPTTNTITAANANVFAKVPVGATILLGGMVPATRLTVTSVSNGNQTITVGAPKLATETSSTATVTFGTNAMGNSATGDLVFDSTTNSITAGKAVALGTLTAGTLFSVSGTANNNGSYVVKSNVVSPPLTAESDPAASTAVTIAYGPTTLTSANFGDLSFNANNTTNTITSSLPNGLTGLAKGDVITIAGSLANNTSYVVKSINATNDVVTLEPSAITVEGSKLGAAVETKNDNGAGLKMADAANSGLNALTTANFGSLTFADSGSGQLSIEAASAGAFHNAFAVGDNFTITGSSPVSTAGPPAIGVNDGQYTVTSNDGTTLTVVKNPPRPAMPTQFDTGATLGDGTAGTLQPMTATLTNGFAGGYGSLNFGSNAAGQMTVSAATVGAFAGRYAAGDVITVAGSTPGGVNDGTYYVIGQDATNSVLTLGTSPPSVSASTLSMTTPTWYKGDSLAITQQINPGTTVDLSVTAADPAFEKALRAMSIICQGSPTGPGGLAANQSRITAAHYLLTDSLQAAAPGTPPYGVEQNSNMQLLLTQVGLTRSMVANSSTSQTNFNGFLDTRIAQVEKIDSTTAIATLLSDNNALQASYQALSKVWSMSLLDFLK